MRGFKPQLGGRFARGLSDLLGRPHWLVIVPLLTLVSFWLWGETGLYVAALGLPLGVAVLAQAHPHTTPILESEDLNSLQPVVAALDRVLPALESGGRNTSCLIVQFDMLDEIRERHGRAAFEEVLERARDRIRGALRAGDMVACPPGFGAVVVFAPMRRLDLESMVQLCARLQDAVAEPVALGGARIYLTCSMGFCLGGASPQRDGASMVEAAQAAVDEALLHGPSAIRSYSVDLAERNAARVALRDELEDALDKGEICAHFQPQISTDTGEISGVEALARWNHPTKGVLSPGDFLGLVETCDLSDRLSEAMLANALTALTGWDKAGLVVPTVSVNFSAAELRNPRLIERIKWELDRFGFKPARLTLEILETVVAQAENDVIVSNISQLAHLGCGIDLDDFGTGHASIATLHRFAVRRIKIDRSFVTRVDHDREQQRMVSAIVAMADQLGLETLAEGVETGPEHAILSQLGCGFVQGFGIAHPMTMEDSTKWILNHQNRPNRLPKIGLQRR